MEFGLDLELCCGLTKPVGHPLSESSASPRLDLTLQLEQTANLISPQLQSHGCSPTLSLPVL